MGQTVILTRTSALPTPMPPREDLATLGAPRATLGLVPRNRGARPVAVVARASSDDERILRGTLAGIATRDEEAGVRRTAVVIVGCGADRGGVPRQPPVLHDPVPLLAAADDRARRRPAVARPGGAVSAQVGGMPGRCG